MTLISLPRLGDYIKRDNSKLHYDDFMFTILSYNVLSDKLAQMHPELYIGNCRFEFQIAVEKGNNNTSVLRVMV